jgi:acetoin utilization deacetylase AcuC-like enzyme
MKKPGKNPIRIIKDDLFLEHLAGIPHPESPDRLRVVYKYLSAHNPMTHVFYIRPRPASRDELALVHDPEYIKEIEGISRFPSYLDPDTPVTQYSYHAAILAAGGLLEAVDTVIKKQCRHCYPLCPGKTWD